VSRLLQNLVTIVTIRNASGDEPCSPTCYIGRNKLGDVLVQKLPLKDMTWQLWPESAPSLNVLRIVVPSYVEVIPCRIQSCCMTHRNNEIDTLMHIMQK
jgi:hypothetical protein